MLFFNDCCNERKECHDVKPRPKRREMDICCLIEIAKLLFCGCGCRDNRR